jgi:hypothetical protein
MSDMTEIVITFDYDVILKYEKCYCGELNSKNWYRPIPEKQSSFSDFIRTTENARDNGPWVKDGYIIRPSFSYGVNWQHYNHFLGTLSSVNKYGSPEERLGFPNFREKLDKFRSGNAKGSLASAAANFYMLEALVYLAPFDLIADSIGMQIGGDSIDVFAPILNRLANIERPNEKKRLAFQALGLFGETIEELFEIFYSYNLYACGGELIHHGPFSRIVGSHREIAYSVLTKLAREVGSEAVNLWIFEAFQKSTWDKGYGGETWAMCAKPALDYSRGNLTKFQYIDRVWSLEHNTGSYLNKAHEWDFEYLDTILKAHDDSDFQTLSPMLSEDVLDLYNRMIKVFSGRQTNKNVGLFSTSF